MYHITLISSHYFFMTSHHSNVKSDTRGEVAQWLERRNYNSKTLCSIPWLSRARDSCSIPPRLLCKFPFLERDTRLLLLGYHFNVPCDTQQPSLQPKNETRCSLRSVIIPTIPNQLRLLCFSFNETHISLGSVIIPT